MARTLAVGFTMASCVASRERWAACACIRHMCTAAVGLLSFQPFFPLNCHSQLLQQLKKLICDLCRLYNLPQHPDVEMLDQPLPAGPVGQDRKASPQVEHVINGRWRGTGPSGVNRILLSPLHFIHKLQGSALNWPLVHLQTVSGFPHSQF